MQALDSDEKLLKDDKKRKCKRDIVQFVNLNKCRAQGNLTEEVLREIPDQVCGYMEQHKFEIDQQKVDERKLMAETRIEEQAKLQQTALLKRQSKSKETRALKKDHHVNAINQIQMIQQLHEQIQKGLIEVAEGQTVHTNSVSDVTSAVNDAKSKAESRGRNKKIEEKKVQHTDVEEETESDDSNSLRQNSTKI